MIKITAQSGGYQAWIKSDQNVLIPIGNLSVTASGARIEALNILKGISFERFKHAWNNYTFKNLNLDTKFRR